MILDCDLIFFDLDGLLVDTERLHCEAYRSVLESYHLSFPWTFFEFVGLAHQSAHTLKKAIQSSFPDLIERVSWKSFYQQKQRYYEKLLESHEIVLMPGADRILSFVEEKNLPRIVVTNSLRSHVEMIRSRVPSFSSIPKWLAREDYERAKPFPDGYLKGIEVLGGPRKKMVGFEDSLRGIEALERAGITPILVCFADHPQLKLFEKNRCLYAQSFDELLLPL